MKPLARLVGFSSVGCPPEIMGIGPVTAIQNVLKATGLKLSDIDLFEVSWKCRLLLTLIQLKFLN